MSRGSSEPPATIPEAALQTPFRKRVLRTMLLHGDTYEEVEADVRSIRQAVAIVAAASVAAVVGAYVGVALGRPLPPGALPLPLHLLIVGIEWPILWLSAAAFAYMVGASFFRGPDTETDYAEILRTTGFAFTPATLLAFSWVEPGAVSLGIITAARIWVFTASIIAVRHALDFTLARAFGTYGVAMLLLWLILWGLSVVPMPF